MSSNTAYAYVWQKDDTVFETYYENGVRKARREKFKPRVAIASAEGSLLTIDERTKCDYLDFPSIRDYRDFVKTYKENRGMTIYHDVQIPFQYIASKYPHEIVAPELLRFNFDIEVHCEEGFPFPEDAEHPITIITIFHSKSKTYNVFTWMSWNPKSDQVSHLNVVHHKCTDEEDLLLQVMDFFKDWPDIITGYNVEGFDVPYLVNRIKRVLGNGRESALSPYGKVNSKTKRDPRWGEKETYEIMGSTVLDYSPLYKKFVPGGRESFKLEYISQYELGEGKVKYHDEFDRLSDLFHADPQKYCDYNVRDVELVELLEAKLGLIALAVSIAYMAHVRFDDVFSPVRTWDIFIYNQLEKKGMVAPAIEHKPKAAYEGAYVKDPPVGMHEWVVSFDVNSMYPSCLISNNITPDMKVDQGELPDDLLALQKECSVQSLLADELNTEVLKKYDVAMTANGVFFRRGKIGLIAEIVKQVFEERVRVRKEMKDLKGVMKKTDDPDEKKRIEDEVSTRNRKQGALKVMINSLYGAYANEYFRYYDTDLAAAITLTSQLYIRRLEKEINQFISDLCGRGRDYVCAVDTDSVYAVLSGVVNLRFKGKEENIEKIGTFLDKFADSELQGIIDSTFQQLAVQLNSNIQYMAMKREKISRKALMVAKKKYAFYVVDSEGDKYYDKPKIEVTGIEVVRSSTPKVCRDWLKKSLEIIFTGGNPALIDFVSECRAEFEKLPFEEVAFPRSASRVNYEITDTGIPIQSRAAMVYNKKIRDLGLTQSPEIGDGDKLKFAYIKEPNMLMSNVVGCPARMPEEIRSMFKIDTKTQFEKAFLAPLMGITKPINWTVEKTGSLAGLFGSN